MDRKRKSGKQVKAYVESKGLTKNVRFFGNRDDVVDFYQAMDCFFLPSLFEGLPVTGVEAQAMGLPMVVSDTVTKEMCYTDLIDFVGLKESAGNWAGHLMKAAGHKTDRNLYSEILKQSVFSDAGCGARLTKIYEEMIQKKSGKK